MKLNNNGISGGTFNGGNLTGLLTFSGAANAGLQLNNLTTTQRDAIASPAAGMTLWNTTTSRLSIHDGSAWTSGFVRLNGDTMTGPLINSTNSAASTPVVRLTGTTFTGGTGTTTKPTFLIEPTGTTSTAWSTTGTMFGVNASSGFIGKILDIQFNGVSKASCDYNGDFLATYFRAAGFVQSSGNFWLRGTNIYMDAPSTGVLQLSNVNTNDFNRIQLGGATSSYPAIKRTGSDIEIVKADNTVLDTAIILGSPNGTRYRISVSNAGIITSTAI